MHRFAPHEIDTSPETRPRSTLQGNSSSTPALAGIKSHRRPRSRLGGASPVVNQRPQSRSKILNSGGSITDSSLSSEPSTLPASFAVHFDESGVSCLQKINGNIQQIRILCKRIVEQSAGAVECLAVFDTAPVGGIKEIIAVPSSGRLGNAAWFHPRACALRTELLMESTPVNWKKLPNTSVSSRITRIPSAFCFSPVATPTVWNEACDTRVTEKF